MIPKGTEILCPNCRKPCLVVVQDLNYGDQIHELAFQPIEGRANVSAGAQMITNCCREPYFCGGQFLHTRFNFAPDSVS